MISKELIQEFREVMLDEYNTALAPQKAHEIAQNLVDFFKLLIEISKKDQSSTNNDTRLHF